MVITNKTVIRKLFDYRKDWIDIDKLIVSEETVTALRNDTIVDVIGHITLEIAATEIRVLEWDDENQCTGGVFIPFSELQTK